MQLRHVSGLYLSNLCVNYLLPRAENILQNQFSTIAMFSNASDIKDLAHTDVLQGTNSSVTWSTTFPLQEIGSLKLSHPVVRLVVL